MDHKQKHEIAHDTCVRQIARVTNAILSVSDMISFLRSWHDENQAMFDYMTGKLQACMPALTTIENQADKLKEYADPSQPEDLPF